MERRDFIRLFSQAQFISSAAQPADLPPAGLPEIAFAGRSNVGKSSAINALAGRKRLAFTSKTPGRTQTINFYDIGAARLADLPGYGFARAPQAMREQWKTLITAYLGSRASLVGVVAIMDARHPLTTLDEQLLAWLGDMRTLVLLSKADKISRKDQKEVVARIGARIAPTPLQLFSSVTRQGVDECRDLLEHWLQQAAEIKSPR